MSKLKTPNQKKLYHELEGRIKKYTSLILGIYDSLNKEAASIALDTDYSGEDGTPFRFDDFPQTKNRVENLKKQFVEDINTTIYRGTSEEWKNSNEAQDLLANRVLKAYTAQVDKTKYKVLYQVNSDALKAFQNRRDKGLTISQKLWNQSESYVKGLEDAISVGIEKGTSAITLSKQISKYLRDYSSFAKEYKEKFGTAARTGDCEYRSLRLAASEINMAYRSAENERWKQMDFVVGYEIKLSGNHNCKGIPRGQFYDICDELKGKYPKDFEWTQWHPLCRCYKVPILKTEEEFWAWDGRSEIDSTSVNEVNMPAQFENWLAKNKVRIEQAESRGTLPYFLRNNSEIVKIKGHTQGSGALNSEFKGAFNGNDISDTLDMTKVEVVSNHYGEKEYTQTVARMQGFDNPSKLVNEKEFEELKNKYGDVFFRTVEETEINGVHYSSKEFADLYSKADKMFMNGRGMRAYGDGIYTTSTAWDYDTFRPITDESLKIAKDYTRWYGGDNSTTMVMTWNSIPKTISKDELWKLWGKLSKEDIIRFNNDMNVFACAKGYDAIYLNNRENFAIILNRSKLAILNK